MSMIRVKRKHVLDSSSDDEDDEAYAGEAIPGLLNDIVVTHILRFEYFEDPADLARLRPVSRAMREAVAATKLRFMEQYE